MPATRKWLIQERLDPQTNYPAPVPDELVMEEMAGLGYSLSRFGGGITLVALRRPAINAAGQEIPEVFITTGLAIEWNSYGGPAHAPQNGQPTQGVVVDGLKAEGLSLSPDELALIQGLRSGELTLDDGDEGEPEDGGEIDPGAQQGKAEEAEEPAAPLKDGVPLTAEEEAQIEQMLDHEEVAD